MKTLSRPAPSTQDRPIELGIHDALNREPFVDNLIRALVSEEADKQGEIVARRATGLVVGLTGRWGLGKSSIINLISERLRATDHVAVAVFNPWLFKGRDELLSAFFSELRDALGRSGVEQARDLMASLDKYHGAIAFAAHTAAFAVDVHGGFGAMSATLRKTKWLEKIKKPKDRSPQQERRSLETKLKSQKLAVVVLIDELDRVEDDDVRAVAQLVKAVGDIRGVSYLVAYDPERVADALGRGTGPERQRSGAAYLEKIVQHPIPLRPFFASDVDDMLFPLLEQHGLALPLELNKVQTAILDYLRQNIRTPREIKRLTGAFSVLEKMVRGEICPFDILAYCWILTKAPALREAIANDFDKVVDDPSEIEMYQRVSRELNKKEVSLEVVFGDLAAGHEALLLLLFPRFGNSGRDGNGDRISRRRNLVRLLYLGDPPGIASRGELERLWAIEGEAELSIELSRYQESGRLTALIDRLDDLLPHLAQTGDIRFWNALARELVRPEDWIQGPDLRRAWADDAATYLMRLGIRDRSAISRVKHIIGGLVAANDLILVPWILRKHLFQHGLTKEGKPRSGDGIFSIEETRALLASEIQRYRSALLDGELLRRIPNVEAIFVISNTGAWDEELRTSLTNQLENPDARRTIAAMMVPPGYGVDRLTLDSLFDAEAVLGWMNQAGEGNRTDTSWTGQCLDRFKYALNGSSPFDDDK